MRCIYCGEQMLFNGTNDTYVCINQECRSRLKIIQHPEVTTIDAVTDNDIKELEGKDFIGKKDGFDVNGIATRWIRGNK